MIGRNEKVNPEKEKKTPERRKKNLFCPPVNVYHNNLIPRFFKILSRESKGTAGEPPLFHAFDGANSESIKLSLAV